MATETYKGPITKAGGLCATCGAEVPTLICSPSKKKSGEWVHVCKDCARGLWQELDRKHGLVQEKRPTKRHKAIAKIAREMGANVTPADVQLICEADRIEREVRRKEGRVRRKRG